VTVVARQLGKLAPCTEVARSLAFISHSRALAGVPFFLRRSDNVAPVLLQLGALKR
jgi:hypothetical protein